MLTWSCRTGQQQSDRCYFVRCDSIRAAEHRQRDRLRISVDERLSTRFPLSSAKQSDKRTVEMRSPQAERDVQDRNNQCKIQIDENQLDHQPRPSALPPPSKRAKAGIRL